MFQVLPLATARPPWAGGPGESTEWASTLTDHLGAFNLDGLGAGLYELSATSGAQAATEQVRLSEGSEARVQLQLEDEGALVLRLLGDDQGYPVRAAEALLVAADGRSLRLSLRAEPGEDLLRLPGNLPQPWLLVLEAGGYARKTLHGLRQSEEPVTLSLERGARAFHVTVSPAVGEPCAFTLLDATGLPVALSLNFPPGSLPLRQREASFGKLEAGDYSAVLQTCDGRSLRRPLRLEPGPTPSLSFGTEP